MINLISFRKILLLLAGILISLISMNQAFAVSYDKVVYAKIDCQGGSDSTGNIGESLGSISPYFTVRKGTEDLVAKNSDYMNSVFIVSVKSGCSFSEVPASDGTYRSINISNFRDKGNQLFIQPDANDGLFSMTFDNSRAFTFSNTVSPVTIKRAVFKGGSAGYIYTDQGTESRIKVTDCKFEVNNALMDGGGDQGGGSWELTNSLIVVNLSKGRKILRLPSYTHDNIIEYQTLNGSASPGSYTDWLFGFYAGTIFGTDKKMGIIHNHFKLNLDLSSGQVNNVNFLVWMDNSNNTVSEFSNNKVEYLGSGIGTVRYLLSNHGGKHLIANNSFINFVIDATNYGDSLVSDTGYWTGGNPYIFINNTFTTLNPAALSNWNRYYGAMYYAYNNINIFNTTFSTWRNTTSGGTNGFRVALDLNMNGKIEYDKEVITDRYCTAANCKSDSQPLLLFY